MLSDEVRQAMQNICGFLPGSRILVGVSGGPDSLCLLDCLRTLGYEVTAAHFNHGLRPEAADDARHVQQAAARMKVAFTGGGGDVAEFARKDGKSIEEAARTLRYRFLFSQAHRLDCSAVAVGHTADDQVETVLMHLLRGAGLAGLRGMQTCTVITEWDDRIPLLRPLLGVWRDIIQAYCAERSLETVFDHSNLDRTYLRNRLRYELIPYLQSYNLQIKEVVWRMSQTANGDYALLESLVRAAWERSLIEQRADFIVLSRKALQAMETGLQRMVLRKAVAMLRPGLRDINFAAIERAARFVQSPTNTRSLDLVAGLCLYASEDRLFLGDKNSGLQMEGWPQMTPGDLQELAVPGRLPLPGGWILEGLIEDVTGQSWGDDPFHAWLDRDSLMFPLLVRTRREGDRFSPLGMNGHSLKLSDFWINQHLPRPARAGWPLVCSGDEIIWIPGFRPAETCRLFPGSRCAIHLSLKREHKGY
ncbi:MAG TPA: tRNA lysidine(34) synthetase TilS [Levilinea sp.]|nr:tRNA lysidine(34) synthetase TilS [Levilinea sp.]